jgi:hypothetical protein
LPHRDTIAVGGLHIASTVEYTGTAVRWRALAGADSFSVGCLPSTRFIVMVILSQVNHIIRSRVKSH